MTETPHIEEVIIAFDHRGTGTEADPHRRVLQVFSKDGKLIAENDPCLELELRRATVVENNNRATEAWWRCPQCQKALSARRQTASGYECFECGGSPLTTVKEVIE